MGYRARIDEVAVLLGRPTAIGWCLDLVTAQYVAHIHPMSNLSVSGIRNCPTEPCEWALRLGIQQAVRDVRPVVSTGAIGDA
jgi:hypothetical protein